MPRDPAVHLLPRLGPRDRVRVELVVLLPARLEVLDELLAALPVAAFQVPLGECTQQQLGLIEPRGMRRREEDTDLRVVGPQEPAATVAHRRGSVLTRCFMSAIPQQTR